MPNVHTLADLEGFFKPGAVPKGPVKARDIENSGHRLSSIRESKLENALRSSIKTVSDLANEYKDLQDICLKQKEDQVLVQTNASKKISQLNASNARFRSLNGHPVLKSNRSNLRLKH